MAEQPPIDIRADHWQIVCDILQRHVPSYEVWAFGSRAKWTAKPHSDLDLAVITDQPLPLAVSAALADDFSESDLPWRVDVVDWATTSETFRKIIERDKVVVQNLAQHGARGWGMGSEWRVVTVEEIAAPQPSALATGPFGSSIGSKHFTFSGIPIIRGSNLSADVSMRLVDDGLVFVSPEKATEFQRSVARRGDLVFTCWGTINQIGFIDSRSRYESYIVSNKQMKLTVDRTKVDPRYLYYVFSGPEKQKEILDNGIGSSVPGFNLGQLRRHEILLPELPEQVEISNFLESLDDRITLLRETNATLEAIAQALFKSWFVDFDPVRAKMEGRAPEGMDEATAALFPDSFDKTELGAVPRGWNPKTFRDTINIIGGGTPKTSNQDYWGGDIPWFSVVDAPANSDVFVVDTEKHITDAGLNGSSTKLLPTGTTIISARGTVGRLALTGRPMAMNQSCYGLRGKAGDSYFTYFSTTRLVQQLQQRAHGSVFDTITQETFSGVMLSYPAVEVISAFDVCVEPLLSRIRENLLQAKTLSTLRDTLLPRLISGHLRLPEAQTLMDAVA